MYCTRQITESIVYVGSEDRRLALFEGDYPVPRGVSYNSYLILDEKTALMDTCDRAVGEVFLENVEHSLAGRGLDYVVVHHMEPDHSATLMRLIEKHPETTVVASKKAIEMMGQFFTADLTGRTAVAVEGTSISLGEHELTFYAAPMVHWPEVMVSYEKKTGILFSADAFGTFGALDGAVFADEVDFDRDYMDEARRYYTNIVGKYGPQVQALLKKAADLDIRMLCPLHGPVWRQDIGKLIEKYDLWSRYEPEERGVTLAYASIYGGTENAANVLAMLLRERGVKVRVFDVSVTHASEVVASAFRYSHLVLASSSYNAGVFVRMEDFLHDLAAHNLQNRTVAVIGNGSWAPTAAPTMHKILESMKNLTVLDETVAIKSTLKEAQLPQMEALADKIAETM